MSCLAYSFSGVDETTPLDVAISTWNFEDPGDAGIDSPSITTVTDGAMLVCVASADENDAFTVPSGMMLVDSHQYNNMAIAASYLEIGTAGATGAKSWVFAQSLDELSAVSFALRPAVGGTTSVLSGTITASVNEDDITTGGKTLIITITGDTFKAAGTGPIGSTADTQALIDGIVSAQSETNGWNAERSGIATTDFVRTSATVATLTVPALATYDITAQETLTVTVPTAALTTGAGAIVSTPTFTISAVSGFQTAWARNSNTVIQVGM